MTEEFPTVMVVDHPLVRHKLTLLRDRLTSSAQFRALTRELSVMIGLEATRDLALEPIPIETPLEPMQGHRLLGGGPCVVSILRAGNGMLDGMLQIMPSARAGHIGLARDEATLEPVEYYLKLPAEIGGGGGEP